MNKNVIVVSILVIAAAFATGRYTAPTKVETKTVTVEVEHKVEDVKNDKVVIEVIKPDGTKTTTITDKTETKTNTNKSETNENSKVVESKTGTMNISILAGVDTTQPKMVYGAAVTRNIIGPFTFGLWGLTNKTVGASLGLQF